MRTIILLGLFLTGLGTRAQTNEAVATIPFKGLQILQENNISYAEFELSATADFLDYMKTEAAKYVNYFIFETYASGQGTYNCKMGFTHPAVIQNFHKMFMALGISKIKVDNKVMPVNELLNLK